MRPPVLIFDFGNVISFFDYMIICERFGRRLGLSAVEFRALAEERGMTGLLAEFERGALSDREFSRELQMRVGLNIPFEEFAADWQDIFKLNESVAALIPGLKKRGHTLVLGSNTNAIHAPFYRRTFRETLDHFDHFVYSHEVLFMKPARGFFEACVRVASAPPESCLFIDDIEENIEGARAAGLRGLVYRDTPTLVAELLEHGVECP